MTEQIGKDLNKLGEEVEMYFCKDTDIPREVNSFFLREIADLVDNEHCPSGFVPSLKGCRIIYSKINGEVASHLIWSWSGSETFIIFTAIAKKYERRSLYTLMHKYYEERIKAGGATASHSTLNIANERIIELSKKNGYQIEYYKMVKKL